MDLATFIGRFHPLLVHLPIGFLLLGILLDVFAQRYQKQWDDVIRISYFLGAMSAVAAAFCGWLLAADGGYTGDTIFWHRWLGVGVAVASLGLWLGKTKFLPLPKVVHWGLLAGVAVLLTITGHLGGNLTHGADYLLEHAPAFLKGEKKDSTQTLAAKSPDEVLVYEALIFPILEEKCVQCHNPGKTKGDLDMSTPDSLQKGGENGPVFIAEKPQQSELFHRVTLQPDTKKFMPPSGEPLSYREVRLLEWWIANGASFEQTVAETELTPEIRTFIEENYGLNTRKQPFTDQETVAAVPQTAIEAIEEVGFKVEHIAENNNFLSVRFAEKDKTPDVATVEALLQAKEQIAWLDLRNCQLPNEAVAPLAELPNLVRLKLEQNPITSEAIQPLVNLENLESLNLYGTQVDNAVIDILLEMSALETVYLWQTEVTDEAVKRLQAERPKMEVVRGFTLAQQSEEE